MAWLSSARCSVVAIGFEQVLGQGGMATIFGATDDKLGREVAVKVLRPEFGTDAQFVERFKHEAQAAASLSHPNIVQVYDYGTDPAGPYIVMEQVSGGDLSSALGKRGILPPTAVANTGQQVADALAAAHARGLVHRDIKPSNILLSPDGRVQVADFGIAQAAARSTVTATGITLGSVLYFSPEQARGDTATAASDIYSLGLVMYEMLTGQRAFSGDSPAAVAVARLSGSVPSPMAVRAEVPPALDAIVRWCLAVDPAAQADRGRALDRAGSFSHRSLRRRGLRCRRRRCGCGGTACRRAGSVPPATQAAYGSRPAPILEHEHGGSGPWTWMAAGLGLLVIVASGILLFLLFNGIGEEPADAEPITLARHRAGQDASVRGPQRRRTPSPWPSVADWCWRWTTTRPMSTKPAVSSTSCPSRGPRSRSGRPSRSRSRHRWRRWWCPMCTASRRPTPSSRSRTPACAPANASRVADLLPPGYLVFTEPRAGASATRDSLIDYSVSTGPATEPTPRPIRTPPPTRRPTPVPTPGSTDSPTPFPSSRLVLVGDFGCLKLADARGQLGDAGLLLGAIYPEEPPPAENWVVFDQLPSRATRCR